MSTPETQRAAEQVAEILRPFVGAGSPYYVDSDSPDRVGPNEPVRDIVRAALASLGVVGLGAGSYPLCLD